MVEAQNLIEDCPAKSLEIFTEALLQAASDMKTIGTNTGKKSMIINGLIRTAIPRKKK